MNALQQAWYQRSALSTLLRPLSWGFRLMSRLRRLAYQAGIKRVHHVGVPVIVVGNITTGGTGKTPLVIWLAQILKEAGYLPGIVARGYRGKARHWPQQVRPDSDPVMVGDEAVVLAARCQCPVAVAPHRVSAVKALLAHHDCNVVISDDGLQHYALGRDIEIAVVDGIRRFGNGYCLPAGPLREPLQRLDKVDYIVVTEGSAMQREYLMRLKADEMVNVRHREQTCRPDQLASGRVHAVAGIGNPQRFFILLRRMGFDIIEHPFPDHHEFTLHDLEFTDSLPVVMTEKDAVKCRRFAGDNWWFLAVTAMLDEKLRTGLLEKLYQNTQHELPLTGMSLESNRESTHYG